MEFSNPSIFSYLILVAIPIIIHLFNFRKYKKIHFSSIHLLSQIEKTTKSPKLTLSATNPETIVAAVPAKAD